MIFFHPKNVKIAQSFNWQMKVGGILASLDNTKFLNILTKSRSVLKDMHPSSCELGLGHHDLASHFGLDLGLASVCLIDLEIMLQILNCVDTYKRLAVSVCVRVSL